MEILDSTDVNTTKNQKNIYDGNFLFLSLNEMYF